MGTKRSEQIEFIGRLFKHRPVVLHAVLQSDGDRTSIETAQDRANMLLRAGMKRRHPDEIDAMPDHGLPKCVQYTAKIAVDGLEFWTESHCQEVWVRQIKQPFVIGVAHKWEHRKGGYVLVEGRWK